jgi:ribonucleoside-diphosphate reductase alpha chain
MIEMPHGEFALFVGHIENGKKVPFEVWVNGSEQPRGLGAVAKTISMDMRANDHAWLKLKLDVLAKTIGEPYDMAFPPHGEKRRVPGVVSAMAQVVRYRCEQLGAFADDAPTPVMDTVFALQEPKTGTDGTLSWISRTRPPAKISPSASRKSRCPTASPAPTPCGCRATIRAPWTACRASSPMTCASWTRRGSA